MNVNDVILKQYYAAHQATTWAIKVGMTMSVTTWFSREGTSLAAVGQTYEIEPYVRHDVRAALHEAMSKALED